MKMLNDIEVEFNSIQFNSNSIVGLRFNKRKMWCKLMK